MTQDDEPVEVDIHRKRPDPRTVKEFQPGGGAPIPWEPQHPARPEHNPAQPDPPAAP